MGQECPGEFRVVGYEVQNFVGDFSAAITAIRRLRESRGSGRSTGLRRWWRGAGRSLRGWDPSGSRLAVTLSHCMPFFDHYEIRIDEGAWERCEESFEWPMQEGVHSLACRGVNTMNRPGISSRIEVAYARPPSGTGYY